MSYNRCRCALLLIALHCCFWTCAAITAEEVGVGNCWRLYTDSGGAAGPVYKRLRLLTCVTGNLAGKRKTGTVYMHTHEVPRPWHAGVVTVKSKIWATSKLVATHAVLTIFDVVFIFILL